MKHPPSHAAPARRAALPLPLTKPGWLALVAAVLLGAPACAGTGQPTHPLQVIIGFADPTDGAAPATLAALKKTSGARVNFVSSISERSHAYQLLCAAGDPACSKAIAALRADPSIRQLDLDQKKDLR